jgi:dipeptidyl aminopeptidase/acylaminoacyl peptidase
LAWSPDGTKLAFCLTERANVNEVHQAAIAIFDVTSRQLERIQRSNCMADRRVVWSSDGLRLAVYYDAGEAAHMRVLDSAGTVLADQPIPMTDGEWSPDGRTLVVLETRSDPLLRFVDSTNYSVGAEVAIDPGAISVRQVVGWRGAAPVIQWDRQIEAVSADGTRSALISLEDFTATQWVAVAREVLLHGTVREAAPPSGRSAPLVNWGSDTMKWICSITGAGVLIFLLELYDRRRKSASP